MNETFSQASVAGRVFIDTTPADAVTIAAVATPTPLTVTYDAAAKTYTLALSPSYNQTFGPSDLDTSLAGEYSVYKVVTPSVAHTLGLRNRGDFQYVASGFWLLGSQSSSGDLLDITRHSFVYGMQTPDAAIPRTGSASFDVELEGLYTPFIAPVNDEPIELLGTGVFNVDFGSGIFVTEGKATKYSLLVDYHSGDIAWRGSGRVGAGFGFLGAFTLDQPYVYLSGEISGSFYGPSYNEVGAAFYAGDADDTYVSGSIVGRKTSSAIPAYTLLSTSGDNDYTIQSTASYRILEDGSVRLATDGNQSTYRFLWGTSDFTLNTKLGSFNFLRSQRAGESDARVTVYRTGASTLRLYNPGPSNPELALTYATFGQLDTSGPVYGVCPCGTHFDRVYFGYGALETPYGLLLRSGSARYEGRLFGLGVASPSDTVTQYEVTGTVSLDADFNAMKLAGSFHPIGLNTTTGVTRDFGQFAIAADVNLANAFSGYASRDNSFGSTDSGSVIGRMYGPTGEEFAGTFELNVLGSGGSATDHINGAIVGYRTSP